MPNSEPLKRYLRVQDAADKEFAAALRDAAADAEKLMDKLSRRYDFGSEMRRAQIAQVLGALREQQAMLYKNLTDTLMDQMTYAADAAAEAEGVMTDYLFNQLGTGPIPQLQAAYKEQARATVRAYQARNDLGIPLAQSVYRTQALSSGLVDRSVNRGLLLGKSAREIAKDVRHLINPNVRGGVSYAAMRLGRTELNNAFHHAQKGIRANDPFVEAMKWNLSGSHPKPDECNTYAENVHFDGGGLGEFLPMEVPGKPHPNCFCYMTAVVVDDDKFVADFMAGKYNTYIDEKIYTHLPKKDLPC
jgi:hypothetical protein